MSGCQIGCECENCKKIAGAEFRRTRERIALYQDNVAQDTLGRIRVQFGEKTNKIKKINKNGQEKEVAEEICALSIFIDPNLRTSTTDAIFTTSIPVVCLERNYPDVLPYFLGKIYSTLSLPSSTEENKKFDSVFNQALQEFSECCATHDKDDDGKTIYPDKILDIYHHTEILSAKCFTASPDMTQKIIVNNKLKSSKQNLEKLQTQLEQENRDFQELLTQQIDAIKKYKRQLILINEVTQHDVIFSNLCKEKEAAILADCDFRSPRLKIECAIAKLAAQIAAETENQEKENDLNNLAEAVKSDENDKMQKIKDALKTLHNKILDNSFPQQFDKIIIDNIPSRDHAYAECIRTAKEYYAAQEKKAKLALEIEQQKIAVAISLEQCNALHLEKLEKLEKIRIEKKVKDDFRRYGIKKNDYHENFSKLIHFFSEKSHAEKNKIASFSIEDILDKVKIEVEYLIFLQELRQQEYTGFSHLRDAAMSKTQKQAAAISLKCEIDSLKIYRACFDISYDKTFNKILGNEQKKREENLDRLLGIRSFIINKSLNQGHSKKLAQFVSAVRKALCLETHHLLRDLRFCKKDEDRISVKEKKLFCCASTLNEKIVLQKNGKESDQYSTCRFETLLAKIEYQEKIYEIRNQNKQYFTGINIVALRSKSSSAVAKKMAAGNLRARVLILQHIEASIIESSSLQNFYETLKQKTKLEIISPAMVLNSLFGLDLSESAQEKNSELNKLCQEYQCLLDFRVSKLDDAAKKEMIDRKKQYQNSLKLCFNADREILHNDHVRKFYERFKLNCTESVTPKNKEMQEKKNNQLQQEITSLKQRIKKLEKLETTPGPRLFYNRRFVIRKKRNTNRCVSTL